MKQKQRIHFPYIVGSDHDRSSHAAGKLCVAVVQNRKHLPEKFVNQSASQQLRLYHPLHAHLHEEPPREETHRLLLERTSHFFAGQRKDSSKHTGRSSFLRRRPIPLELQDRQKRHLLKEKNKKINDLVKQVKRTVAASQRLGL